MSEEDETGYRKPPKHTQFKKGQSGNPKGRPKKTKDLEKLLERELDRLITVRLGGETHKITFREAIVKKLVVDAAQGDWKAIDRVFRHMADHGDLGTFTIDEQDVLALQRYVGNHSSNGD